MHDVNRGQRKYRCFKCLQYLLQRLAHDMYKAQYFCPTGFQTNCVWKEWLLALGGRAVSLCRSILLIVLWYPRLGYCHHSMQPTSPAITCGCTDLMLFHFVGLKRWRHWHQSSTVPLRGDRKHVEVAQLLLQPCRDVPWGGGVSLEYHRLLARPGQRDAVHPVPPWSCSPDYLLSRSRRCFLKMS